jgi:hypothetical protein
VFYSGFGVEDWFDEDCFVSVFDSLGFLTKFNLSSKLVYLLNLLNPFTFLCEWL